ncbi:MAG: protein tyrosine phosphatase [Myxococcales bacterium]|nr:protein tyrosine phosphatase [Myxococcales bacterium]
MSGYIDLHCHFVAGIDDGAPDLAEGIAMLRGLASIGFASVVATPHMRAMMFENSRAEIEAAFAVTEREVKKHPDLPDVSLSCEHHLDDTSFASLLAGRGLPYPPAHRAALIEFPNEHFPAQCQARLFDLRMKRIRPVLAHPERYRPVWKDVEVLVPLMDGGTLLLLDVAALDGKYGGGPKQAAHALLEAGYYYAACSDAHRARDVREVDKGIKRLFDVAGREEGEFLLREGPRNILEGTVAD